MARAKMERRESAWPPPPSLRRTPRYAVRPQRAPCRVRLSPPNPLLSCGLHPARDSGTPMDQATTTRHIASAYRRRLVGNSRDSATSLLDERVPLLASLVRRCPKQSQTQPLGLSLQPPASSVLRRRPRTAPQTRRSALCAPMIDPAALCAWMPPKHRLTKSLSWTPASLDGKSGGWWSAQRRPPKTIDLSTGRKWRLKGTCGSSSEPHSYRDIRSSQDTARERPLLQVPRLLRDADSILIGPVSRRLDCRTRHGRQPVDETSMEPALSGPETHRRPV